VLKHAVRRFPLIFAGVFALQFAAAQSGFDVHFGGGVATDSSNGQSINTFGDGNFYATPKLDNTFLNFGGGFMLTPHFGVGGEMSFQPGKSDYAGLQYRPIFYDFNAIWQPTQASKHIVPELQAGIGAVNLRFYDTQQGCNGFTGCSTSSSYLASSNHFQTHFGGGVRFYLTSHLYVQPQVDVHWVNDFFQFGSNWVPQYSASFGYHFGER
jgi:hypothetical protein